MATTCTSSHPIVLLYLCYTLPDCYLQSWDKSATARSDAGKNIPGHKGNDQLCYAMEDIFRGAELGLRSVLVADLGLLSMIQNAKEGGELPEHFVSKISVQMGPPNAATAKVLENLCSELTLNPPTDLDLCQLGSIRSAVDAPLDVYVEAPDNFGGYVRHFEVPAMVWALAPLYVKLGLRNRYTTASINHFLHSFHA